MIQEIKNNIEKAGVNTEEETSPIVNIIQNSEKLNKDLGIIGKKYPSGRGPDKKPRKLNENSIRNLKQFQSFSGRISIDSGRILTSSTRNSSLKLSSKILILFFIIFVMIIGWHIWKYYKARQACNLDNLGVEK